MQMFEFDGKVLIVKMMALHYSTDAITFLCMLYEEQMTIKINPFLPI